MSEIQIEQIDQTLHLTLNRPEKKNAITQAMYMTCLLYTSPSPRDRQKSRMPSSA